MKKIILVGNWSWEHCEKAFSDNLKNFKFKVIPFVTQQTSIKITATHRLKY